MRSPVPGPHTSTSQLAMVESAPPRSSRGRCSSEVVVDEGIDNGGAFILNPTNGSSYTGTILQTQQIASSRLRAIETGRWVVQVSPTGFSAFVSPDGDVFERTAVSEQKVVIRTIAVDLGSYVVLAARRRRVGVAGTDRSARRVDRARQGLVGCSAGQTSSRTVTGPSLINDSCISVRNRPAATMRPEARS